MTVMANNKSPKKPVAIFRSHGISAKVFENYANDDKRKERPFYAVRTEMTYKQNGTFRSEPVFKTHEVMIANELNQRAWQDMLKREENARKKRFEGTEE